MARYQLINVKTLDLHPYCSDEGGNVPLAIEAVRAFIIQLIIAGEATGEIVHGKGRGKLRGLVHKLLDEYQAGQLIQSYEIRGVNTGSTIVHLAAGATQRLKRTPDPVKFAQRPFETLKDEFVDILPPKVVEQARTKPRPVSSAIRREPSPLDELEDLARALTAERREQEAAPAPLSLQGRAVKERPVAKTPEGIDSGHSRADLEALAREAAKGIAAPKATAVRKLPKARE